MIFTIDEFLTTEECNTFIDFFENSPDKYRGETIGDINPSGDLKEDIEVTVTQDLSEVLSLKLNKSIIHCLDSISSNTEWDYQDIFSKGSYYSGFKIQQYKRGEGHYKIWHQERDGSVEFSRMFVSSRISFYSSGEYSNFY